MDDGARTILTICAQTGAPRTHTIYEANNAVCENVEAWVDGVEGRAAYPFAATELTANYQVVRGDRQVSRNGRRARNRRMNK